MKLSTKLAHLARRVVSIAYSREDNNIFLNKNMAMATCEQVGIKTIEDAMEFARIELNKYSNGRASFHQVALLANLNVSIAFLSDPSSPQSPKEMALERCHRVGIKNLEEAKAFVASLNLGEETHWNHLN